MGSGLFPTPALALAAVLGGCATPPSPLEEAARAPVPYVREAFPSGAPAVLPAQDARLVEETMAAARARGSLTLEDCVRSALASGEDVATVSEDRLQALLRRDVALSGLLPDVRMLLRHDRQDPVGLGGRTGSTSSTDPNRTEWSLNVIQPLYRGLREFHAMRSAERTADALAEDVRDLRRALATSVARAFILAVESDAEIRALEEALRLDDERILEIRARTGQGLARRTEVLLQESRRETTRASLSLAAERRDAARAILGALAGARIDLPLDPGPSAAGAGPVPSREGALAEAMRLRSDVRAADRRLEAAGFDVRSASALRLPVVAAEANWYLDRWNYSEFSSETRWDLGLFAEIPLFQGGRIDALVRDAESAARQAAIDRSRVLRRVVQEVDVALLRLKTGLERLESFRSNERFARENLALLQEEYRLGLATNLEMFTAQVQHQDAAVGLERQEHQSRLDRLELFLAMGRDDVVGVPPHPAPAKEKP